MSNPTLTVNKADLRTDNAAKLRKDLEEAGFAMSPKDQGGYVLMGHGLPPVSTGLQAEPQIVIDYGANTVTFNG